MNAQQICHLIEGLPHSAQVEAVDFITFLKERYSKKTKKAVTQKPIQDSDFVGMWQDREDMKDSHDWVRTIRKSEWKAHK